MKNYTCSEMINHLVILKSKIFIATLFSLFVFKVSGQVANYTFSQSTSTYTALSTSTPLFTTTWDDNVSVNVAIGFDFVFSGKIYNTTRISSNGFITFGSNAPDANNYTPISYDPGLFGSANYEGAVSAFGRDLINNSSSIVYGIEGVSPNRVFVVQWNNARRWSGGAVLGDVLNFQIRLYETNNVVQVRYGTNTITNTSLLTAQVGLRGTSNADFNNRASATNWSMTTAGTANGNNVSSRNNIVPAPGLTFTWIPPACSLLTLPYLENFDTGLTRPNLPSCWRVLDANSDGSTWKTGNGFPNSTPNSLFYEYNSSNVANDWAFSPGFNMVSGEEYEVVFSSRVRNATYPENLRVAYGNARTATGMSNTIATLAGITNTTYSENRYTITPSVSGTYYLGFQAYSNANQWELHVDDIKIIPKIKVTPSAPAICKGGSVSLTASSPVSYTYTWSPATGLSATTGANVTASPARTTTYTVTGTSGSFTTTKEVAVMVNLAPNNLTVNATVSPLGATGCDLDYVKLDVLGVPPVSAFYEAVTPESYSWTRSGPVIAGVFQGIDVGGSNSSNAGGSPAEWMFYNNNTNNNLVSDWLLYANDGNFNNILPVSLEGYSAANVSFKSRFISRGTGFPRNIYLEMSFDGILWQTLWSQENIGNTANLLDAPSLNLSSFVGSVVYFRFRYTGNSGGLQNWYIDDISITGTVPSVVWSPNTGLYNDAGLTIPYLGTNATTVYAAPDTSTNFVASSSLGACSKTATTSSIIRTKKVFTGLDATNPTYWNQTENWATRTLPTSDKCVVIPSGKTVVVNVPNAAAKSVTVQSGGKLTINANQSLTVQDEFVNQAAAGDVLIASDGNLIQVNNSAPNSALITAQKVFTFTTVPAPNNRRQYNFVTSPVIDQNLKTIYPGNPTVLYHQESNNFFGNSSGAYIRGRGLAVQEPNATVVPLNTVTANFVGAPFNGILNYPLVYSNGESVESKRGFNLTGNPYPSNLDVDKLFTANSTKISATIQFWDNRGNTQYTQYGSGYNGSNYARYNAISGIGVGAGFPASGATGGVRTPTKIVKAGTGFMVQALVGTNGQTLNFNNAMRTGDAGPTFFGKTNEAQDKDRYWLTLKTPSSMEFMTAVVYFAQGSKDFGPEDSGYSGTSDDIYTFAGDKKLSIQGRDSFAQNDKVDLGVKSFEAGLHTLSLLDKDGIFANGQNIYLKDKDAGIITNISQGSYTFSATAGENNTRFEIIYEPETVLATDGKNKEQIIVYRQNNDFVIKSPKDMSRAELYDTSGKLIKSLDLKSKQTVLDGSALINGIYILKIQTKDGEIYNKKILK